VQPISHRYLLPWQSHPRAVLDGRVNVDLSSPIHKTDRTLQKCNGFEFMKELVDAMTDESPERRPTIEEVIERFGHIRDSLSTIKLRSLIPLKKDPRLFTAFRHVRQLIRTARYIVLKKAAIPIP